MRHKVRVTSEDMVTRCAMMCLCYNRFTAFYEYTSRLQRMFQYIGVSKDLNENFKRHLTNTGEPLDIDFSIQVLSSGSWPFQQSCVFSLPTELERCVTR